MTTLILYAYNPVTLNNYITCFLLGGTASRNVKPEMNDISGNE